MRTAGLVVALLILCLLVAPVPVAAHGLVAGGARVLEVDAGPHRLRVEAVVPTGAPTQLVLRVSVRSPLRGETTVSVHAAAAGAAPGVTQRAVISAGAPALTTTTVAIDRIGLWDVAIEVVDATGSPGTFVLPVTILPAVTPPTTLPMFAAFGVIAVLLALMIFVPDAPAVLGSIARIGIVSALTLISALAIVTVSPQVRYEWNTPTPYPLPFFTAALREQPETIEFLFFDGATGLPADDFVPHHQALVHTVCIEQTTNQLVHLHPARTGPGLYVLDRQRLPAGSYTCTHEAERRDSGSQIVQTPIDIKGSPGSALAFGVFGQSATHNGYQVTVSADAPIEIGTPVQMTLRVMKNGSPIPATTPWLGMRGHLIVVEETTGMYGHVHAVGAMDEAFEPVPQPGNTVSFVYAFPRPGVYRLWYQVQIGEQIVTVPIVYQTGVES